MADIAELQRLLNEKGTGEGAARRWVWAYAVRDLFRQILTWLAPVAASNHVWIASPLQPNSFGCGELVLLFRSMRQALLIEAIEHEFKPGDAAEQHYYVRLSYGCFPMLLLPRYEGTVITGWTVTQEDGTEAVELTQETFLDALIQVMCLK